MDTRKRNVLIGVGAAILVVVVILVVLMVSGGSTQDKAASKTDSAVAAASDASSKDVGVMHASGDGTADNEVDASEVYGDSPDAATGESERKRLWLHFGQPAGQLERRQWRFIR